MKNRCLPYVVAALAIAPTLWADDVLLPKSQQEVMDSLLFISESPLDSTINAMACDTTDILRLTEDDFRAVAEELGVEVPAIKAVVEIEAGRSHQGFSAPGKPIINFDLTMFRQFARRNNINLAKFSRSHSTVFMAPQTRKYGSQQAAQHARLEQAMSIDKRTAVEGTFWGMFQIGGFNWRKCGVADIDEFVTMMSRSEHDQLELFARFIDNSGLTKHLKAKNWAAFARGYNGPSYAKRGYHRRLAAAYAKYQKQQR